MQFGKKSAKFVPLNQSRQAYSFVNTHCQVHSRLCILCKMTILVVANLCTVSLCKC
jgi:hypothetical protein